MIADLEVLKWARANGCTWDEWTCSYAAESGRLAVLQWAHANGCPWDKLVSSDFMCMHIVTTKDGRIIMCVSGFLC